MAATGGSARHSLVLDHALRPLFSYLRATAVPTGVYAASEDWGAEGLAERIDRAAGELAALMGVRWAVPEVEPVAAGPAGATGSGGTGGLPDVVPFEQQLAALRAG
jgi:FMN reductase